MREQNVTIVVRKPVQLREDPNVELPAGRYPGIRKELGVAMSGGQVQWTPAEYRLALGNQQLQQFGAQHTEYLLGTEHDVTAEVRTGEIQVQ